MGDGTYREGEYVKVWAKPSWRTYKGREKSGGKGEMEKKRGQLKDKPPFHPKLEFNKQREVKECEADCCMESCVM